MLADNGYPDVFVDLLYVAAEHRRPPRMGGEAADPVSDGLLGVGSGARPRRCIESDGVGRLFADLGADVLKIEPPGGSDGPSRVARRRGDEHRVRAAQREQAQRGARSPPAMPTGDRLIELAAPPTSWWTAAIQEAPRHSAHRARSSPSGSDTWWRCRSPTSAPPDRMRSRRATDPVLYAMSTALSRTGPTVGKAGAAARRHGIGDRSCAGGLGGAGRLLSPVACGTGDYIDFSRFEGVLQALDPPFGSEGQAAVGLKRCSELWRGRPRNQQHLSDIRVQGRSCSHLPAVAAAVARNARLARRARTVRRSEVRHHRGAIRRVTRTQCRDRRSLRGADDGRSWSPRVRLAEYRLPRCSRRQRRWRRSIFARSGHWPTVGSPQA